MELVPPSLKEEGEPGYTKDMRVSRELDSVKGEECSEILSKKVLGIQSLVSLYRNSNVLAGQSLRCQNQTGVSRRTSH